MTKKRDEEPKSLLNISTPDDVAHFVVVALARYIKPAVIIRMVKEEFHIDVDKSRVVYYDHTRSGSHTHPPAKKWIDLFNATRKEHLRDLSRLRLANKAERIKELTGLFNHVKREILDAPRDMEVESKVALISQGRQILKDIGAEAGQMVNPVAPGSDPDTGNAPPSLPGFIIRATKEVLEFERITAKELNESGRLGDGSTEGAARTTEEAELDGEQDRSS